MTAWPRPKRFAELLRRLWALPPAGDDREARRLIETTLNAVEDEFSGVPFDPQAWRTDGRMYPFQDDGAADVPEYPNVTSYRSRKHETFIASNGAFEIRNVDTGAIEIAKPGTDGKGVWS